MYELTYTSAARRLLDLAQLAKMLERARLKNAKLGVSGILLYDAGSFIQVLEGEEAVVLELFDTIARDDRHQRIHVLHRRSVEARSFSEWSMGFVTLDQHIIRHFPKRHGFSSNGSLIDRSSNVEAVLDEFRSGRWRSFITG